MVRDSVRPWQRLPLPHPRDFDPGQKYFYENFAKPLVKDFIKIMCTGINIDPVAVENLTKEVDVVLASVDEVLSNNPLIKKVQSLRAKDNQKAHKEKCLEAIREIDYYLKPYNPKDIIHRTWVVNNYLSGVEEPREKWALSDLKKYNIFKKDPFISSVIDGKPISEHLDSGMLALAKYKLELWNRPRIEKSEQEAPLDKFNAGSAQQKQKLFSLFNIEAASKSDTTGDDSWNRENLEILLKSTDNEELIEVVEKLIDHPFSAIIKNNFLSAFDRFTINSVLHGNIKLFGAKSFRPTSNAPNLLNMPSSGSAYAKPLKKCFVAPEGKLIIQADYASLEDVVLADLTLDAGKLAIQKDPTLDAHCYNALGYYTRKIEDIIGKEGTYNDKVRRFKQAVEDKHPELKALRQASKPITFKLAYLGFPDESRGGLITQTIYDNYHNALYPGVKSYLDDYVIPRAKEDGYIHLGLGCRIYTDDVDKDHRTLFNANFQFWSVLTLIAVNEMHHRIDEAGLSNDIQISATIYDSIYSVITADPEIIKWYNDNLVEVGAKPFIENQEVATSLSCGIGRNWAEEVAIPKNATVEEITEILNSIMGGTDVVL